MKSTLILAAAAGALAQNLSGIPECAVSCIASAIGQAGCAASDAACQCGPTQSAIVNYAQPCVLSACAATPTALLGALSAGNALCSQYSATAGATPASTSAALTTTTAAASSGSSSAAAGSTTTSSGTVALTTTSTSVASTGAHTAGSNHTVTTGSPSSSTKGTTSGGASAATTSTNTPNAAATLGAGALIGLLGIVAAL